MLELRNLTVGYAREPVLRDFSLALPDGPLNYTATTGTVVLREEIGRASCRERV